MEAPVRPASADKRRLLLLLVLLPILIAAGAWLGGVAGGTLARKHRVVNLAERLQLENTGVVKDTTDASTAFRDSNKSFESLAAEARGLRGRYTVAARWCGAWVGLVIGLKLSRWPSSVGGRTTRRIKAVVSAVRAATAIARRNFSGSVCPCPPLPSLPPYERQEPDHSDASSPSSL